MDKARWRGGDLWNCPDVLRQQAAERWFGPGTQVRRLTSGLYQSVTLADGSWASMGEDQVRAVLRKAGAASPVVAATPQEGLFVLEVGARAWSWAQDCNPYELNEEGDIMVMIPREGES